METKGIASLVIPKTPGVEFVVCVTGGRSFVCYDMVCRALGKLNCLYPISLLIEGGATGADRLCRRWAKECGVRFHTEPADWDAHGRAAGPIRNRKMLDTFKPSVLIAFPGGSGTTDCQRAASDRGIITIHASELL